MHFDNAITEEKHTMMYAGNTRIQLIIFSSVVYSFQYAQHTDSHTCHVHISVLDLPCLNVFR